MIRKLKTALRRMAGAQKQPVYTSEFFAGQQAGSRSSAGVIIPIVVEAVRPRTVVDVGCGVGTWSAEFMARDIDAIALDGDYVRLEDLQVPHDRFKPINLEDPPPASSVGSFDLAICLEVAEHLRPESAGNLIDFLTDLAPHVLFSAAIPGQGGRNHVNEQWQSYWVGLFAERGFSCQDIIRPAVWASPDVRPWYAQNAFLFSRGIESGNNPLPADLVHPRTFHLQHRNESRRHAERVSLGFAKS